MTQPDFFIRAQSLPHPWETHKAGFAGSAGPFAFDSAAARPVVNNLGKNPSFPRGLFTGSL
jgi:hypothetical protein